MKPSLAKPVQHICRSIRGLARFVAVIVFASLSLIPEAFAGEAGITLNPSYVLVLLLLAVVSMLTAWRSRHARRDLADARQALQLSRHLRETLDTPSVTLSRQTGKVVSADGGFEKLATDILTRAGAAADAEEQDAAALLDKLWRIADGQDAALLRDLPKHAGKASYEIRLARRRYRVTVQASEQFVTVSFDDQEEKLATADTLQQLRACLGVSDLMLWVRDQNLDIIYRTAAAESIQLDGGNAHNELPEIARRALRTGSAQSTSHHVIVQGKRVLHDITETPLGELGGTVGIARDVSQLEQVQAEMDRHIAAHNEVLQNLGVGICVFGPDRRLKFYNQAYADIWGLDHQYLRQQPLIGDLLETLRVRRRLPEVTDFRAFRRDFENLFTSLIEQTEVMEHLPNGETLRRTATPHPFGGLLMTYENVTDRLALESSYNTLIEVQRESLDSLQEAISVYGSDNRLRLFNPTFCRMWHFDPASLDGTPHFKDLLDQKRSLFQEGGEGWLELERRLIHAMVTREPRQGVFERTDGMIVQFSYVPLPDGNMFISQLDVTDRYRVERALTERAEALEQADRLKSEFIANISYELRTPLNAIIGFSEILDKEYFGTLNPRQKEYSQAILNSSERLVGLINNILDLAIIEAGYLELEIQEVDVAKLGEETVSLVFEGARHQGVHVETDMPAQPMVIKADPRRLKQALGNILSNAIKYSLEGDSVTLRARAEGKWMVLAVQDRGPGMAPEALESVFKAFSGDRTRHGGAGLGLALVKSLIELHDGHVDIESAEGQGTTVLCHLPIAGPERPHPSPPPAFPPASGLH